MPGAESRAENLFSYPTICGFFIKHKWKHWGTTVVEKKKGMKRKTEDERIKRDRDTIIKGIKKEQNREHWTLEDRDDKMDAQ